MAGSLQIEERYLDAHRDEGANCRPNDDKRQALIQAFGDTPSDAKKDND
ncbi:hypothetical protein OSJ57_20040 [Sphingomonas sp. HH69]